MGLIYTQLTFCNPTTCKNVEKCLIKCNLSVFCQVQWALLKGDKLWAKSSYFLVFKVVQILRLQPRTRQDINTTIFPVDLRLICYIIARRIVNYMTLNYVEFMPNTQKKVAFIS